MLHRPPSRSFALLLSRLLSLHELVPAQGTDGHGLAGLMGAEGLQQVGAVKSMSAAYEKGEDVSSPFVPYRPLTKPSLRTPWQMAELRLLAPPEPPCR